MMLRTGKQNTGTVYSWKMPGVAGQTTFLNSRVNKYLYKGLVLDKLVDKEWKIYFFYQNAQSPSKTNEIRREKQTQIKYNKMLQRSILTTILNYEVLKILF